jgi:hypothetical protein
MGEEWFDGLKVAHELGSNARVVATEGDNRLMAGNDRSAVLEFVDLVLGDLRLRDRMFVARRPEAGESRTVVIQSGEEGRCRLTLPQLGSVSSVETFVARVQAHLAGVYGRPVPRCPLHDHALVGKVCGDDVEWVCPEGAWRCAVGEYEERTWPPSGLDGGNMAAALSSRLGRRGIVGVRRVGVTRRAGGWVASLGVWPMSDALTEQLRAAAAPVAVDVQPLDWGPADAVQTALDRRLEEELQWARWAVDRWAEFPVDRVPRPLVLVGPDARPEGGFVSGQAKEAYLYGRFDAAKPVPAAVLALLPARRELPASGRPALQPLVITEAALSQTEFWTDRGRHVLPAWRLTTDGTTGPIWVLDPETASRQWTPPDPPTTPPPALQAPLGDPGARIILSSDHQTATYAFTGALPCYEEYPRAEVIESDQAVAIVPVAKDVGPPGPRILPGYTHQVKVKLRKPLGHRVFVDLHGNAGEAATTR